MFWFPIHLRLLPCSVCLEIIVILRTKVWPGSNHFVVSVWADWWVSRPRLGSRVRWEDEILVTKFSQLQPIDTQTSLSPGFSHLARISPHDTRRIVDREAQYLMSTGPGWQPSNWSLSRLKREARLWMRGPDRMTHHNLNTRERDSEITDLNHFN